MTTLDDAAAERIAHHARYISWAYRHPPANGDEGAQMFNIARHIWEEATEAAAKKCEERAEAHFQDGHRADARTEAENCAAAIRGKG